MLKINKTWVILKTKNFTKKVQLRMLISTNELTKHIYKIQALKKKETNSYGNLKSYSCPHKQRTQSYNQMHQVKPFSSHGAPLKAVGL